LLYCIYIDYLLVNLYSPGIWCYIGSSFVSALAFADDIVFLTSTPSVMCKMLRMCNDFASSFDVIFNTEKSKFLAVVPNDRHFLYNDFCKCCFCIGSHFIENIEKYSHLGHIVSDTS
jgi:hypothetical protein